jgi:hypothetical protein
LAYAYYNWGRWDNWLYFVQAHGELGNSRVVAGIVWPWQVAWRYLQILVTVSPAQYEWWVAVLEVGFGAFAAVILVWMWRRQWRLTYLVQAGVMLLLPLASGTFSGFPRYVLSIVGSYVFLAHVVSQRPAWQRYTLFAVSFALQVGLVVLFSRGYFIA